MLTIKFYKGYSFPFSVSLNFQAGGRTTGNDFLGILARALPWVLRASGVGGLAEKHQASSLWLPRLSSRRPVDGSWERRLVLFAGQHHVLRLQSAHRASFLLPVQVYATYEIAFLKILFTDRITWGMKKEEHISEANRDLTVWHYKPLSDIGVDFSPSNQKQNWVWNIYSYICLYELCLYANKIKLH